MTIPIIIMMIVGLILIIVSFFVAEGLTSKEENYNLDLITIDENYEFSDRELRIIKRKIEDVIANHAKEILYETNDSLASMANEKTLALGDYAVAVCEEIEKQHKEVMFLYSMLDDKQKEIMNTVRIVDEMNRQIKETLSKMQITMTAVNSKRNEVGEPIEEKKTSAIDQLSALAKRKREADMQTEKVQESEVKPQRTKAVQQSDETVSESEQKTGSNKQKNAKKEIEQQSTSSEEEEINEDSYSELGQEDEYVEGEYDEEYEEEYEDEYEEEYDEEDEEEYEEESDETENSNDIILKMHRNGSSIIEIAKQLGLGVGEVKLVIDLYRGE